MNGPNTAIANWKTQYYLNVTSIYEAMSGTGWYDSGTSANAIVTPLTVAGTTGTQYVFTGWSLGALSSISTLNAIVMTGPVTVTANWQTQYYLTVNSTYGIPGGSGWYNSGTNASATVSPLTVPGAKGTQYIFTGWSGNT